MMKRVALIASLLVVMSASYANAAVTFTVDAIAEGGDINNMAVGDTLTLDVTMRSDADVSMETVFAVGAAVFGYTPGSLTLVSGTTSTAAFVAFPTGPGAGFGGLDSTQLVEEKADDEVQWFNGVSISGTDETGVNDISPITSMPGDAHAQIIFTVNESTTLGVGASMDYGDAVVGDGGSFLQANNAEISITVPEPGAVASSLAALGSVFAVVGLRRRS